MKQPPEEKKPPYERLEILAPADTDAVRAGHAVGAAIAAGHLACRGIQVLPGNHLPPSRIAEIAAETGKRLGFEVTVLDPTHVETAAPRRPGRHRAA